MRPEILNEFVPKIFNRIVHGFDDAAVTATRDEHLTILLKVIVDEAVAGLPVAVVRKTVRIRLFAESSGINQ